MRRYAPKVFANPRPLVGNVLPGTIDLANAAWLNTNLTLSANVMLAPDGTMTADLAVPTSTNALHALADRDITTTGGTWVARVRVKHAGYPALAVQIANNNSFTKNAIVYFDIARGCIARNEPTGGYIGIPSVRRLSNHWLLCEVSIPNVDVNVTHRVDIYWGRSVDAISFAGDTVSGLYAWGVEFAPMPA